MTSYQTVLSRSELENVIIECDMRIVKELKIPGYFDNYSLLLIKDEA
jgi:hypothetical protein